jgi:hypothetical protein
MTLEKHKLDGLPKFTRKTEPVVKFEAKLKKAGYYSTSTMPAKGNRVAVIWEHPQYRRIKAIHSSNQKIAITAYHIK